MGIVKFVVDLATVPMNLNVYNLADKAIKGINKVAELETSDVVRSKDFDQAEYVESTVC